MRDKATLNEEITERLYALCPDDETARQWLKRQLETREKYEEMLADGVPIRAVQRIATTSGEKIVARGGGIKASENGVIEGYLVAFTDETHRDFYNEYFSVNTEFLLDHYPPSNAKVLYQHGLDDTLNVIPLADVEAWERDNKGIYVKTTLDLKNAYHRMIYEMAKAGLIGWSSGALPSSAKTDDNGQITQWAIIEASLTPNPAEKQFTQVSARASELPVTAKVPQAESAVTSDSIAVLTVTTVDNRKTNPQKGLFKMNEALQAKIQELISLLSEMGGMDMEIEEDAVRMELADEMEKATDGMDEETMKMDYEKNFDKYADLASKALQKAIDNRNAKKAKMKAKTDSVLSAQPAKTARDKVGGAGGGNISVSENLKYAHLSASDMALGIMYMSAPQKRFAPGRKIDLRELGLSDDYIRHFAQKANAYTQSNPYRNVTDNVALKSAMPIRANELDASDIATQGQEWVAEWWATDVWRKERDARVYDTLVAKGMMVKEIGQGYDTANFPTEGNDPTVYSSPQANDVDATQRPEVTAKISPFTTGVAQVVPGEIKAAVGITVILTEDSIVNTISQANYQLNEALLEARDSLCINGDTATGANTNINLIDSTPGTGISRPFYLATNGFRKLALVTNTAQSRSASGGLSIADYRETLKLLPSELRQWKERLLFIIDPDTDNASLGLPEIATDDVRRTFATITSGVLTNVYGIQVFTSGFLNLANTAGKISNTGSNNTTGSILLVYPRYWGFAYKRQITLEQDRDILSGTDVFVASMRMGLVPRSTNASAITYNVGV